jgi:hypothetical protein
MKSRLSILFLLLSLSNGLSGQENKKTLHELEWILGNWKRLNSEPGVIHLEKWWKVSDQQFQGIGLTMKDTDTLFVEKLFIRMKGEDTYYIAEVEENPAPVYFKFTSWERNSFVSENPEHDAPKKIEYILKGKEMTARVSWDDGGFEAVFIKLE